MPDKLRCHLRTGAAPQAMATSGCVVIELTRPGPHNVAVALRHYSREPCDALSLPGLPTP